MQAMKVDNAMNDSDTWEVKARNANMRRAKLEEDLDDLIMKSQKLEVELDKAKEELALMEEKLSEKDSALNAGEMELSNLNRQVQEIENSLEDCDDMMTLAVQKLDKAETACDDNERLRKVMESKAELDVADLRAEVGEHKIIEMEEELQVVANNLRSLEVSEEKANEREKCDKALVTTLTAKLKQAESRAQFAEKSVQKLQNEVDQLEDCLLEEQEKLKNMTEEVESTFVELSGY